MRGLHPAQVLDRVGFGRAARALRTLRWRAAVVLSSLADPRLIFPHTWYWLREPFGRPAYRVLNEDELQATRRSDTVFVLGSGRSLVDISPEEWERIGEHDVVGFSHTHRQNWVRVDYHLIAEVTSIEETAQSIAANPLYRDTIFGVMSGWMGYASNGLVARRLLPRGARIFRWRRIERLRTDVPPTRHLADGLVHGVGSIQDVVNFALVLGWRRVVVVGVDLYNREYFWLPAEVTRPDERPGLSAASRWPQADLLVQVMRSWRAVAESRGIQLLVYDPRSVLAEALPQFEWQT